MAIETGKERLKKIVTLTKKLINRVVVDGGFTLLSALEICF